MRIYLLKDVPTTERPREKLEQKGAQMLSNQELLAILLRSGTKDKSALILAQELINGFDHLSDFKTATLDQLTRIKGVGKTKAVQILAAIEFGKRINQSILERGMQITSPSDCAMYISEEVRDLDQEHFIGIYLDSKNRVIHKKTLFVGTLSRSLVHPREVYKEALRHGSAAIIVVHNHPSGVRLQGSFS